MVISHVPAREGEYTIANAITKARTNIRLPDFGIETLLRSSEVMTEEFKLEVPG